MWNKISRYGVSFSGKIEFKNSAHDARFEVLVARHCYIYTSTMGGKRKKKKKVGEAIREGLHFRIWKNLNNDRNLGLFRAIEGLI